VLLEVDAQLPEGRRYRFMMCQSVLWIDVNGSKLLMPTCVLVSKPSTATHCQFSLRLLESLFLWANYFSNSVIHLHGTNPAAKPISSLRHLQDPYGHNVAAQAGHKELLVHNCQRSQDESSA